MAKKVIDNKKENRKKGSLGALFIPAGILIGFGIGFAVNNLPAAMFIGLGAGFLGFAFYEIFKKK